ncbi:UbiD family decarboxylase [Hyphococcus luteus]|uniref:3,4-dihydroxybenzoate decarboxylase n=1 Tax=Hyphococcus luteus TaxID=2058213 RepID=A0A2S7KBA1_9PROT|nr:UbiD family decarboxylase [Marinicaulis flavus]PQA89728.1 3,4-dihydroxybenzoate decarboxylase [Marinicaulis flavus]
MAIEINDLRSAIDFLRSIPGQFVETSVEVDPFAELAGVYRHIGAGGTVQRPTQTGPMMMFNAIKGHPGARVAIGILGSRERVSLLLGARTNRLGHHLNEALKHPVKPVMIASKDAPCHEVVHEATDPDFDIRKLIPAPTNTSLDAGPFITMGLVYGQDPENGDENVAIHRLCLQSRDEISIFFCQGRHLDVFRQKAEAASRPFPVSVNIGLDPAVYLGACFEPPATPLGFNELDIAGALRNRPVEMVPCKRIDSKALARAEIVIEGEILPNIRVAEDKNSHTGRAMPEFPGYNGRADPSLPILKVRAVTNRSNAITQTTIGPGEEHVNLAGIPTEASILTAVEKAMPGCIKNVYASPAGGGKLLAIMQVCKRAITDQGRERQAAICALASFSELKTVVLVDDDVDIFDPNDVLWAMATRYQSDVDTIILPGVRCHQLDPSQRPGFSSSIQATGVSCKTIFDCTVPFHMREEFQRAQFMEVDYRRFLPDTCL